MPFDIKLVIAAVITLGLIGAFLLSNSTVGNLIAAKMTDFRQFSNISFVLEADRYGDISFDKQKNLSITIEGKTSGNIGDGEFTANSISLEGFGGKGRIGGVIVLNGSVDKIELSDASLIFKGKSYESSSEFSRATFNALALKELRLENITGVLKQSGTEIKFSSATITLEEVSGRFSFGSGIAIDGHAKKILIPKAGIRIE